MVSEKKTDLSKPAATDEQTSKANKDSKDSKDSKQSAQDTNDKSNAKSATKGVNEEEDLVTFLL
jgi:hypothetical protein